MSATYNWCQDKTRLATWDKPVFFDTRFGDKAWYLNGQLHRENGPAVEYTDGGRDWYLYGKRYSESDYWKRLRK